jgi:hypothetical protein
MEARNKVGGNFIVQLVAAKKSMELCRGVADLRGTC